MSRLLLLPALLAGFSLSAAAAGSPPDKTASTEDFAGIRAEVELLRGKTFTHEVPVYKISEKELRAISDRAIEKELPGPKLARYEELLTWLDIIPPPIVDELSGACALLRANAWERLGRLGAAVDLLSHYKFESDAFGQQLARSFMSANARLDLCPKSELEAERRRQRALGRRRIPWTKGMIVILGFGVHFAVGGLLLVAEGLWSLYSSDGASFGLSIAM